MARTCCGEAAQGLLRAEDTRGAVERVGALRSKTEAQKEKSRVIALTCVIPSGVELTETGSRRAGPGLGEGERGAPV